MIFTLQKSVSIVEFTHIMSISRQNLSVIIVSFKSDHVIHRCISSIDKEIEIIVIENSNNTKLKKDIEEQNKVAAEEMGETVEKDVEEKDFSEEEKEIDGK